MSEDLTWTRVHPVTPAVKGWKVLAVLIAIGAQQVASVRDAEDVVRTIGWGPVIGVIAAAVVVGFVYATIAWRMTRYAVDAEAIYLQNGVLFRQQRSARLDRIQAIDVVQPVLARILGLAELKMEVAGGSDSAVRLSYLKEESAQALRNALLARAAGLEFGTEAQPEAPVAPERELISVPAGRLVVSLLRSPVLFVPVVLLVGVVVVIVVTGEPSIVFAMLPVLLGSGGYLWQRFAGEFGFRAAQSPDGIRLRHGLLEARAQTVPPGRVQAVRLSQPLLWRSKDWWRVQVNVAGYGKTDEQQTENVLLPVGDRHEALLALWLVLPDLGADDPRALLDTALSGGTSGEPSPAPAAGSSTAVPAPDGFITSPRSARWLDPWSWSRNGYAVTRHAILIRRGRFQREVVVVPHARTQSLGLRQGPVQRRLDLATVILHSTPGPVAPMLTHLDAAVAGGLVGEQAARARTARAGAGPERWMLEMRAPMRTHASGGPVSPASPVPPS